MCSCYTEHNFGHWKVSKGPDINCRPSDLDMLFQSTTVKANEVILFGST